jgi:hypothetical protein
MVWMSTIKLSVSQQRTDLQHFCFFIEEELIEKLVEQIAAQEVIKGIYE